MLDWFSAITNYTYVAYLPTYFRSQGISAVATQVRPSHSSQRGRDVWAARGRNSVGSTGQERRAQGVGADAS